MFNAKRFCCCFSLRMGCFIIVVLTMLFSVLISKFILVYYNMKCNLTVTFYLSVFNTNFYYFQIQVIWKEMQVNLIDNIFKINSLLHLFNERRSYFYVTSFGARNFNYAILDLVNPLRNLCKFWVNTRGINK